MFILGPKHNFFQIHQCAPKYEKISQYKVFILLSNNNDHVNQQQKIVMHNNFFDFNHNYHKIHTNLDF